MPFPADRAHPAPALTDFADFLKDRELLKVTALSVDTPEIRWRAFLARKYATPADAGQAHGRVYADLASIRLPQSEADFTYCLRNTAAIRRHFLYRNFDMVFQYILLYGRGVRNTLIY